MSVWPTIVFPVTSHRERAGIPQVSSFQGIFHDLPLPPQQQYTITNMMATNRYSWEP
jgi:hypothetical protein